MLTRAHLVLSIVMIAAPAHARHIDRASGPEEATPRITIGVPDDPKVSIAHVTTDAREVGETAVITLTVELDGPADLRLAKLKMSLPPDAGVVGMTFERNGQRLTASTRDAVDAGKAFEQVQVIKRDPALLEWTDQSEMRLSLYPVTAGERPTATMTITLPRFRRLLVDVAADQHALVGGTFPLPSAAEIAAAHHAQAVTSGVSLLAMPPPSIDDVDLHVENSQDAIKVCSMLADPDASRDITLTFVIGANGDVVEAGAGASDVGACAARLASTWRFASNDRPTAMHYRLHLSVSR